MQMTKSNVFCAFVHAEWYAALVRQIEGILCFILKAVAINVKMLI